MTRYYDDELYHFGIKGMHWGVRRFQQANGSLTTAGKKRYLTSIGPGPLKMPANAKGGPGPLRIPVNARSAKRQAEADEKASNPTGLKAKWNNPSPKQKTALKIGATVAVAGLAVYGGHQIFKGQHSATSKAAKAFIDKGKQASKQALAKAGNKTVSTAKKAGKEVLSSAKKTPGYVWKSTKEGVKSGIKDGAKIAATGGAVYAAQKYYERKYGNQEAKEIIGYGRKPFPKK